MKALRATMAVSVLSAATAASGLDTRPIGLAYPSGPAVPENLLRIELRFSAPLRTALSIDNVKLIDVNGHEIEHSFLDLPLPGPDGKRVTILLHPGRLKSGLRANLAFGRALHAGSVVTLVVDDPALSQPIRKTWEVTAFDAESPRPSQWTFEPPRRGTRTPIEVHLDAPISSSAEALIAIRGPDGRRLAGATRLESGETVWRFVPAQPWRGGSHAVVTHPDLEDPAGNRPCGPFEAIAASRVRCDEGTVHEFEPRKASAEPNRPSGASSRGQFSVELIVLLGRRSAESALCALAAIHPRFPAAVHSVARPVRRFRRRLS